MSAITLASTIELLIVSDSQCINVMILMNLLIAMMNATMIKVQAEKVKEWKFARTGIWLKFFARDLVMPVPFNLVENLIQVWGWAGYPACSARYTGYSGLILPDTGYPAG